MENNKLPTYEQIKENNQCVCYYDYTFVVESIKGFVSIFENEYCLAEIPITCKNDYLMVCDYWYDLTKDAKWEQEIRKENKELELLEMYDILELGE